MGSAKTHTGMPLLPRQKLAWHLHCTIITHTEMAWSTQEGYMCSLYVDTVSAHRGHCTSTDFDIDTVGSYECAPCLSSDNFT